MSAVAETFLAQVAANVDGLAHDADLHALSRMWIRAVTPHKYPYNFSWLGRPMIQLPQDVMALQETIWRTRPQVIVETGIAHGGSLIFHASMLQLLGQQGRVIGVDVDIRAHNRAAIEAHPLAPAITLVQGSSIDEGTVRQVRSLAGDAKDVMVVLDSNHTHDHVLAELHAYSPLVRKGGALVVMDTLIEDLPASFFPDRPWKPGNSPKSAVREFLTENRRFEIDREMDAKLLISACPQGYLRCVEDP